MNENFSQRIIREAQEFYQQIQLDMAKLHLNPDFLKDADHLCYRTSSVGEYIDLKNQFFKVAELLVESQIGEREIATYRFSETLVENINVLELAAPKDSNLYALGFEHLEIVISESFENLEKAYPDIKFDKRGSHKKINPELRILFDSGASIKFHHQSLEDVIEYEKTGFYPVI